MAPTTPRPPTCSGLYLETHVLGGFSTQGQVARLRGALGVEFGRCARYVVRVGGFAELGSEEVGDAFAVGPELEVGMPHARGHVGGRVAVGLGGVKTFSIGPRFRRSAIVVGADAIYSSKGAGGHPRAVAVVGVLGLRGKAALAVTGIAAVLALIALSSFQGT